MRREKKAHNEACETDTAARERETETLGMETHTLVLQLLMLLAGDTIRLHLVSQF